MEKSVIEKLERIVGESYIITQREQMLNYLVDESPKGLRIEPSLDVVLLKPANTQQVSDVLRLANDFRVPVYPRGAGTGLVGGAVPTSSGIVLSMERMDKVEIDTNNLLAVAEAGVTLEQLAKAANEVGLSFPPHPGDESAQVGGLVATNAGGSRAVRHGVMRNQVRAIQAVLPSGEILNLGGKISKNNVGYDIMQLVVGSEGTLVVITKATLRLYPKAGATMTLIVPFENRRSALSVVPRILRNVSTPLAIEYVEKELIDRTARYLGVNWPVAEGFCYLIVIMAEPDSDRVLSESLKVAETCHQNTKYETFAAESKKDQDNIMRIRSNIYTALKSQTDDILDVTVPVAELERVIGEIEKIGKDRGIYLPIYGHAADGNLHVHVMKNKAEGNSADNVRNEIYAVATRAGGVITGEHGIGKARIDKVPLVLSNKELQLMKNIKAIFDPNGILNPGTKLPV